MAKKTPADMYKAVANAAEKGMAKSDFWKFLGDTDYNPDKVSIKTYQKMLEDAQVQAATQIGVLAVMAKGYDFEYKGKNEKLGKEMIDYLRKAFSLVNQNYYQNGGMWFVMKELFTNAKCFGYSVGETVFGEYDAHGDGKVYPDKLKVLPPNTLINCFSISDMGDLESVTQNKLSENEVIFKDFKDLYRLIVYTHNRSFSDWYGRSDLKVNYPNWFIKNYLIKFWNIMLERYGAPFLLGKVTNPAHIMDMNKALDSARTKTNFSIWKQDEVEIIESSAAQSSTFQNAIKYHDTQIMTGQIVPSLLMGIEGTGARALGDVHFRVWLWKVKNDQREFADIMNAWTKKLIDMNFDGVDDEYPKLTFPIIANEDLIALADTIYKLITAQVTSPDSKWVKEMLGVPADEVLVTSGGIASNMPGQVPGQTPGQLPPKVQAQLPAEKTTPPVTEEKRSMRKKPKYNLDTKKLDKLLTKHEGILFKTYQDYLEEQKTQVMKTKREQRSVQEFVRKVKEILIKFAGAIFGFEDDAFREIGLKINSGFSQKALDKYISNLAEQSFKDSLSEIADRAKEVVLEGWKEGLSKDEIAANVASVYEGYSNSQLKTVVRTIIDDTHNESRLEMYKNNRDFVKGVRFDAVMDERTTPVCVEHNGMMMSLDNPDLEAMRPPLHFCCRSLYTPVTILDGDFEENFDIGKSYPDEQFGGDYFREKYGDLGGEEA